MCFILVILFFGEDWVVVIFGEKSIVISISNESDDDFDIFSNGL